VPWNFDWTRENAILDDDFFSLYSNLPFDSRFFAIFDCCHAGGIHRESGPRARGISAPDDIRHRTLRWDKGEQMWLPRDLPPLNKDFGGDDVEKDKFMGKNRATYRIGRGMKGRVLSQKVYTRLAPDERGPYLPVIIEACQEGALSYEYRDGTASYGAFTYSMVKNLRAKPGSSFEQLVTQTAQTLKALNYPQQPQILGPRAVVTKPIPGGPRQTPAKQHARPASQAVKRKGKRAAASRR
jgi:hypothetical protein